MQGISWRSIKFFLDSTELAKRTLFLAPDTTSGHTTNDEAMNVFIREVDAYLTIIVKLATEAHVRQEETR